MVQDSDDSLRYFPWDWTIESLDQTTHKCPSVSSLLGTFAIVNGVVSLLAVFFGHRLVVKKLTCGFFGKRGSRAWTWMWILPVGLQLAANAFIALLIKKSTGYTADFKISELMLFLVARPRLSWIVLGAFAFKSTKNRPEKEKIKPTTPNLDEYQPTSHPYEQSWHESSNPSFTSYSSQTPLFTHPHPPPQHPNYPYYHNTTLYPPLHDTSHTSYHRVLDDEMESSRSPSTSRGHGYFSGSRDFPWWSAFMSQFIGEFILQIITLYLMGRTAHFATLHGYYKVSSDAYWALPPAARMMYSGALYYLVGGGLFLIFAGLFIVYSVCSSRIKYFGKASSTGIFLALAVLLISTWMGSWIFWAGFVRLAGNLYCPPKLIHQGVIWTFFSTIGIVLGTGI
ncbi:uncharacterized protein BDR25DRAFT_42126 [Lindgomyces ingoldianus]|uniref:Uncharacterized protein n=1 Tax=Lindgomyces ingoldianus TaxID=673940 RepID=A0ACB6RCU0_9PLEO|nr:uncharacterized protein BDR25DRAFT_42126 [Lindgomyces ingoldianus]KAF2476912.1 hypothetical protein BDR25DRAFT_42126 [Lindgomyces ingoldianus]